MPARFGFRGPLPSPSRAGLPTQPASQAPCRSPSAVLICRSGRCRGSPWSGGRGFASASASDCKSQPRWTRVALRFPSWHEHGGIAILGVGLLNGFLVVTGFAMTWLSTLKRYELECRTQHFQSELRRTEQQLELLFGPLKAITHASHAGFSSFIAEHEGKRAVTERVGPLAATDGTLEPPTGRSSSNHSASGRLSPPSTTEFIDTDGTLEQRIQRRPRSLESEHYRQVVSSLQALNRRVMETVLSHTHLIDGEFPDCLYAFYAHVIQMDALLVRWAKQDYSVMLPLTPYPGEVNRWAEEEFNRLRGRQKRLMRELQDSVGSS